MSVTAYAREKWVGVTMDRSEPTANGEMTMAKKKAMPTKHSAVQRDLKTPKYQMRVVEDKSKYRRNRDKSVRMEDFRKAA